MTKKNEISDILISIFNDTLFDAFQKEFLHKQVVALYIVIYR